MKDAPGHPDASLRPTRKDSAAAVVRRRHDWRGVWQLPALVVGGAALAVGVTAVVLTAPKPDFDAMIRRAEGMITSQEYQPALDELNQSLRPWYDQGVLSEEHMRQFHLLRARAIYLGQRDLGLDLPENARSVIAEYGLASRDEPLKDTRDRYFLADAHVSLGLYQRAIELAQSLPAVDSEDSSIAPRSRIYRRVIERQLRDPEISAEVTMRLLVDFLRHGEPNPTDRAWALSRQAKTLIRGGEYEAAVTHLLRSMPALISEIEPDETGELYMLLGRAYMEAGAVAEAGRQVRAGLAYLIDTDDRWARAMVLLARVDEATVEPPEEARAEAKQKFAEVVHRFAGSPERLPALLGLAEVEAALGDIDASVEAYRRLVDAVLEGWTHPDLSRTVITSSLLMRWRGQFDQEAYEAALRFALLGKRLWSVPLRTEHRSADADDQSEQEQGRVPPDVLLAVARSYRAVAEEPLGELGTAQPGEERARQIAALDVATRQMVRSRLVSAAQAFRMHADAVGIADNVTFGESLWLAAESYDLAGELHASIPLFADYVKYFPGDPRRAEARYRLGRAYQALGEYAVAAEHFRALIADARRGRAGAAGEGVGPYADLSMVPLAQVLLLDADPSTDAEAETLLSEVVAGRVGGTSTPQFREGLVELGMLLHRRGDFAGAIARLDEAVSRFPSHPDVENVRFALAEAHRRDAMAIRRTLDEAMPDHRRQMLEQTRLERLRRAERLYEEVRSALELKDPRRRTRLEDVHLRNSYFYLGDCAFELGEYELAIQRYDAARERFPDDPATLVAMVQIVNAYVEQEDMQRAATANERARRFYQSLPKSAWDDPDLPMSREDWQRWLDSMTALRPVRSGGEVAGVGEDGR